MFEECWPVLSPSGLILWPFLPVGWMNLDWPLSFGVNPGLSAAATREHEFVHDAIHDCKAQVTVSWNFLKGADMVPHASPCRIERQFPP